MKEICVFSECTGCMACVQICAKNAIEIYTDDEGFKRPKINTKICVDCGMCINICPNNTFLQRFSPKLVYSGWSNSETVRVSSSSGGAFSEIARIVLDQNGIVFGCSLNEHFEACHISVDNMDELAEKLRGSKYVQSDIGDSFIKVKQYLESGRLVLFSGTPCQISGLRSYLRRDYVNLITVDLICHGVPSPKIFKDYLKYQENEFHDRIKSVNFRSKMVSWKYYGMLITFHSTSRKHYGRYYDDPYIRGFLRDYFIRPSCHSCKFVGVKRVSDFTIADWWGYTPTSNIDKDYSQKGVSLILVNTEKAVSLVGTLNMSLKERSLTEAIKTNKCLKEPFKPNPSRANFWKDYDIYDFQSLIKKYMYPEKVSWNIRILQRYPNTSRMDLFVSMMMIPKRIFSRIKRFLSE